MTDKNDFPYLHGFSEVEQKRLRQQAAFAEQTIYQNIDFSSTGHLLEIGSGVGAQSEIILRRFPKIKITGIDLNERQLQAAKDYLGSLSWAQGRYDIQKMDATKMSFANAAFDGAFLCWVLEHIPSPQKVLSEIRRVLKPGSTVVINEVMNHSFFLDPYSPNVWKYWMAFNDFQYENAGDPFIGAKLGNLLLSAGYQNIETQVKTWHLDNRNPAQRKDSILFWSDLLMSASETLLKEKVVDQKLIDNAKQELIDVANDPNAVFYFSFMQAKARV